MIIVKIISIVAVTVKLIEMEIVMEIRAKNRLRNRPKSKLKN